MNMRYYHFTFAGYSIGMTVLTLKCINDPYETAKIVAQAEAIRNGIDYTTCEGKEISAVEYYVLRAHKRIDLT